MPPVRDHGGPVRARRPAAVHPGLARRLPEADRLTAQRVLARPGAQTALIADLRESYRQGTTVMASDLLRYSQPWDFSFEEVTTTAHLWHGEQDPKVPIALARQVARRLPHCQARFGTGGHLMACDHADEIVTALTSVF